MRTMPENSEAANARAGPGHQFALAQRAIGFSGRGESGIPKGRPETDSMRIDSPGGGPCAERIPVRCECESLDLWRRERRGVRPPNSWRSARVLRLDGCDAWKRTKSPRPTHADGEAPPLRT